MKEAENSRKEANKIVPMAQMALDTAKGTPSLLSNSVALVCSGFLYT